jgi:hypothetical protein
MFCGGRECEVMVFWCIPKNPKFRCPMNLLFWTKALLWILHSFCSFGDTKSILHHDRHYPEMAGNQPSCHYAQENRLKISIWQESWLPTISFASSLSKHMELYPLQDCKERRCQEKRKNMEKWYIFYRNLRPACILSRLCNVCDPANHTVNAHNILEVLHHSKHTANLIKFKKSTTMALFVWLIP